MLSRPRLLATLLALSSTIVVAGSAERAARTAPEPAARADVPLLARIAARRVQAPAMLPMLPAAAALHGGTRLAPDVTGTGSIGDRFGSALAFDGDTLLVGAFTDTTVVPGERDGASTGTATVYRRAGGDWAKEAVLAPKTAQENEQMGVSVAIDGDVAVAGARFARIDALETGAAHVFVRTGTSWAEATRLLPVPPEADAWFGQSVAVDGNLVVVGAPLSDRSGFADAGAAFVFRRTGEQWLLVRVLVAPDARTNANFGASVRVSGDDVFVGAPGMSGPGNESRAGAVYTFEGVSTPSPTARRFGSPFPAPEARLGTALAIDATRLLAGASDDAPSGVPHGSATLFGRSGALLTPLQRLLPPDGAAGDGFGVSVGIDGSTLGVGAPDHNVSEGAGYVYVASGPSYGFQAKVEQPDGPFAEVAGESIAIVGDELLLGAPLDDIAPNRAQGSVRRYQRSGSAWSQAPLLQTGDGAAFEAFGIAVGATESRIAVGAYLDDSVAAGDDAGSVTIYAKDGAGGWRREARLEQSDAISQDRFGISVAMRDDEVLAGSYFNVVDGQLNRGAVYAFGNDPVLGWTETQKLTTATGQVNDFFGFTLARQRDTLLVGAPGVDSVAEDSGSAFVFERVGGTWTRTVRLDPPEQAQSGIAGFSVAIDGELAFVGAPDALGTLGIPLQGAVFVYRRVGAGWPLVRRIEALDGNSFDEFGISVSAHDGLLLVGALQARANGVDAAGAAYLYRYDALGETLVQRLESPAPVEGGGYGVSVAIDGNRALVGELNAPGPDGESAQGRAWSAPRNGFTLGTQVAVAATVDRELQVYGRSLSMSGSIVAVGAPDFRRDNPREGGVDAFLDDERIFRDGFVD